MTWPKTESVTRTLLCGWSVAGNPPSDAMIWHVTSPDKPDHIEADVRQNGKLIETLVAPTQEAVVEQLERRYHRSA